MCDTQVLIADNGVWFAKNSDREPSEPQPVCRFSRDARRGPRVRTTFLEIEHTAPRFDVIISQPAWCWGAEIGVNAAGVAIGNEAIFSRLATIEPALLGMDLVRLGLEGGDSAESALTIITELLERYGQGGPAGFRDKGFHYDNSFIIADADSAWVLETAGRHWVAKRVARRWAISNQLTIGTDYDRASDSVEQLAAREGARRIDFARRFDTRIVPWFAGASRRRGLSCARLDGLSAEPGWRELAAGLRAHAGSDAPLAGGPGDVCLHANGFIRRSQTTGSMVAHLAAPAPRIWATGTSAPCLSIFRPVAFEGGWSVLTPAGQAEVAPLWRQWEHVHRRALFDDAFREQLRASRDATEEAMDASMRDRGADGLRQADAVAFGWAQEQLRDAATGGAYEANRFWRRLNRLDEIAPTRTNS